MWREYNPNPVGRSVGDCVVRALSAALDIDWEQAFELLAEAAFNMGDMPSSNEVLSAVLRMAGFRKKALPNTCPDCYTFEDFAIDHPRGIFVLGTGTHVATIRDGILMDSWNSSERVPKYFWYKQERNY